MKFPRASRLISYAWAAALLAACSSGPSALNAGAGSLVTTTAVYSGVARPDTRTSWLSNEVTTDKSKVRPLLFVSDQGTGDVYIFKLPALTLAGSLTGFSGPQGECTDAGGDVWITNFGSNQVFKYSHTGERKGTLTDPNGASAGCSWDATTGNLAVTNFDGGTSIPGAIEIYAHGTGTPHTYANPAQFLYYFAGYDPKGNLFFDGFDASEHFVLSELPKGGTAARTIHIIGGTIYFPGMVQWDAAGNYLAVGDQECGGKKVACIYRVQIKHSDGSLAGQTKLDNYRGKNKICDLVDGSFYGSELVGADDNGCGTTPSTAYTWPYPAGGNPTAYNNTVLTQPIGAAVSK